MLAAPFRHCKMLPTRRSPTWKAEATKEFLDGLQNLLGSRTKYRVLVKNVTKLDFGRWVLDPEDGLYHLLDQQGNVNASAEWRDAHMVKVRIAALKKALEREGDDSNKKDIEDELKQKQVMLQDLEAGDVDSSCYLRTLKLGSEKKGTISGTMATISFVMHYLQRKGSHKSAFLLDMARMCDTDMTEGSVAKSLNLNDSARFWAFQTIRSTESGFYGHTAGFQSRRFGLGRDKWNLTLANLKSRGKNEPLTLALCSLVYKLKECAVDMNSSDSTAAGLGTSDQCKAVRKFFGRIEKMQLNDLKLGHYKRQIMDLTSNLISEVAKCKCVWKSMIWKPEAEYVEPLLESLLKLGVLEKKCCFCL